MRCNLELGVSEVSLLMREEIEMKTKFQTYKQMGWRSTSRRQVQMSG